MKAAFLLAAAMIVCASGAAEARSDFWTASGRGSDVAVSDCAECGDDIGILLTCEARDVFATMSLPFMALPDQPSTSSAPIRFSFDGQVHRTNASFELWGMVGHVPVVAISDPSDPLLQLLRMGGDRLNVLFGGGSIEFLLDGAPAAMNVFLSNCGAGVGIAPPAGDGGQPAQPQSRQGGG